MANTFQSISSGAGILMNFYQGPIKSQFNDSLPLYGKMETGSEKFNGLQVVRPLKVRRNQGIGSTSDGGLLPQVGAQNTQQATISAKYNYLRFGLTGPLLKASQGTKGSFVSDLTYEMEQGLKDLKCDVERQLFWNGNGQIATVGASAVASTTLTVTGRESTDPVLQFLDAGALIDIYTAAGTLVASAIQVLTISASPSATSGTITLSAPVTTSSGDIIVRSGSYNNDIQGLLYALDGATTTIYSIPRATYPVFQGNVISNSGAQLTLNAMQTAFNEGKRRGDAKYDLIACNFAAEAMYNKLLVADKRYIGADAKGDGSFSDKDKNYLAFGAVPVVPSAYAPLRFFFLSMDGYKKYVLSELEWATETGEMLIAQTGVDAWEARLRLFANIFPEMPASQAVLGSFISP